MSQLTGILTEKVYLGDAVYGSFDGYYVVLTTENGIRATNTICLEPEVLIATRDYLTQMIEAIAKARRESVTIRAEDIGELEL